MPSRAPCNLSHLLTPLPPPPVDPKIHSSFVVNNENISLSDAFPPSSKSGQGENYLPVSPYANKVMGENEPIRRTSARLHTKNMPAAAKPQPHSPKKGRKKNKGRNIGFTSQTDGPK